jgi:SRSO17 transposase
VAVTLSIANHHASLPIAYRLYLPKDWADDAERRNEAHVPAAISFKTKPQIALAQLRAALAAGVAPGVVLMDASYGTNRHCVSASARWRSPMWPPSCRPPGPPPF